MTAHSPLFYLRYVKIEPIKGKDIEKSRISAVVPIKIAKKAVQRNKIRRQIYEATRAIYGSIIEGANVIIFAKEAMKEVSFMDMEKGIKDIFVKARLLR